MIQTQNQNNNHAILGACSGMLASLILHPLEVLKIGIIINPSHLNLHKKSVFQQFKKISQYIYRTEGYKGYYRGLVPEIARSASATGIYFYILKEFGQNSNNKDDLKVNFISSALARMASTYITNPLGVVASRCEVPGFDVYKNTFDGIKKIYKYEGLNSFMKGSWTSALKEGPFAGTYYMIYRYLQKELSIGREIHYSQVSLISGMIAGFFATSVSHPFEIIRARMQIISKFNIKGNQEQEYKGIFDAFRKIYANEGFGGYFTGLAPRLIKKPLINSLTFVLFEIFHNQYNQNKW